jgi:hypothetical protein
MEVGDIEILEIEPSKREDRGQPDRSAENFNGVNIYAAAVSDKILEVRVFSQPSFPVSARIAPATDAETAWPRPRRAAGTAATLPHSRRSDLIGT